MVRRCLWDRTNPQEKFMKRIILAAVAASAFFAAANVPVVAAPSIHFDFGNVSLGYSDGYWDNGHKWHAWRRGELAAYRNEHRDNYHAWRHNDKHHH
jgi:hypothetical protein